MCFKRLPHPSQLNIPVSLPVKGRVVCLQQEVSKSLGLLAAAHSVCFHRPRVLRRKIVGCHPLLLIPQLHTLAL